MKSDYNQQKTIKNNHERSINRDNLPYLKSLASKEAQNCNLE
ncbi:hypothetical protein RU94_GL000663 [Enterococcus asini]|nr:hypothetical protein RU94_GL000663 [Enterococcus asini]